MEILLIVKILIINSVCFIIATSSSSSPASRKTIHGRYTRHIEDFKLLVPHKLTKEGEFLSYDIPHYFDHDFNKPRHKRSLDDPASLHYGLHVNNKKYHVELWPNHKFLSPNLVFEERQPNVPIKDRKLPLVDSKHFCHYTGRIRGHPDSKVALSTCNGLAGYISIGNKKYFIEPVHEHEANEDGQHLHVVYERHPPGQVQVKDYSKCGTEGSWEDAWKERFREQIKMEKEQEGRVEKRGLASVHRYLETLVVCDKRFMLHHQHVDVELYVLTIMNMVADFYHDSSGGNQMDVVVVRIMYLMKEEEEIDLIITPDADKSLASFCKWQQRINPQDINNPNHHDIAVLLTRYDICADKLSNCGLTGLAYVAAACTKDKPCAINEDSGLVLAIVVAHEMGHVMGCSHDKEGESTCPAQDADESYFIMAPFVHMYTTRWSTCSRAFITSLFENDLGECLNDEPQSTLYPFKNALPGTIYDAQAQCNMNYPGSTVCIIKEVRFCEILLCKPVNENNCMGNDEPPADGTKCGENRWCFRKECVEIGERPEAVNGGWGEWSSWSDCSRTCGGGVSFATRECDNPTPNHKGRYCLGDRKKVKTCNMDPCPEGSPSFRDVQCAEHNKKPFNNMLYQWTPHFVADEPCVLYCINQDHVFAKLEPRVRDGTSCKPGTKDMCIGGVCKKVGCDGEVDSTAVEDVCGICNGDGTQCRVMDEVYTDVGAQNYKKVATIPSGSRMVHIEELGSSVNTIAISDKTEQMFYLNGNYQEETDGPKKFGKVDGIYTHPEPGKEVLDIHGPLEDDIIFFVVFYKMENVGYQYKYSEMTPDTSYTPHYQWELLEWTDCTTRCGGGVQQPKFVCVEDRAGKVSDNFCADLQRPFEPPRRCNDQPCKTKWKVGTWSKCHACKYKTGVKMREVECVMESPRAGGDDILVEDRECHDTKPGSRKLCNSIKKCKGGKRSIDDLPDNLMAEVWHQTSHKPETLVRKSATDDNNTPPLDMNFNKEDMDEVCTMSEATTRPTTTFNRSECVTKKVHLDVGKIIKDRLPEEEIKLIRVPLKPAQMSQNLSDTDFETMGDVVGDRIDSGHAQEVTGKQAAEILKSLQHPTSVTGSPADNEDAATATIAADEGKSRAKGKVVKRRNFMARYRHRRKPPNEKDAERKNGF